VEHYGILSILPPLMAIVLAIVTKQVLISLFLGIFTGTMILTGYNPIAAFIELVGMLFENLGDASWNAPLILFLMLLGGLVGLFARSGAAASFGRWASQRVTSRPGSLFATWLLGVAIFLDDYFNCLTVGTVMRPLTDHYRVSREKLSYIIDSTAAPVCMLIPLSSWIAYVMSLIGPHFEEVGFAMNPFQAFLAIIPLNLYAWLAVIMVLLTSLTRLEFGPMAAAERRALGTGILYDPGKGTPAGDDFNDLEVGDNGAPIDLIVPVLTMIITAIIGFAYTGGYFDGGMGFFEAIWNTDAAPALAYAAMFSVLVTVIFYAARGVLSITDSMDALVQGFKSMVIAVSILLLAWTIGGITGELGTGAYVTSIMEGNFPLWAIPATIFVVSSLTSFSTGTSWGTMGIMIPIVVPLIAALNPDLMLVGVAAVLAGATFGDHCSPISDTTIMSSTGAGCHHIDHVNTQLPYAVTGGIVATAGFLVGGFIQSGFLVLLISVALLLGAVKIAHTYWGEDVPVHLPEVASTSEE
jgi:tetracycline resistance efflux pump